MNIFLSMGLLPSIGFPLTLVIVFANYFGKIRINWYWLVPLVTTYTLLIFHIIVFGVTFQESFPAMALIFTSEVTFFTTAYCMLVNKLFGFRFLLFKNIEGAELIKLVLSVSCFCFFALVALYAVQQNDGRNCSIRCKANSFFFGFPPYVWTAAFPLILLSGVVTILYLLFIVGEKRK